MAFTNDYSQAYEAGSLKPEGDYEVLITKFEERRTKAGKLCLNLSMVIRNDVEQKYQNGFLFHTFWKRRDPSALDQQVEGYSFSQLMSLGRAAGLPDKKEFASLSDFLQELVGKPLVAHLMHDEYNGEKREAIAWFNPTAHKDVAHVMKKKVDVQAEEYATTRVSAQQTTYANAAPAQTADDDLPF